VNNFANGDPQEVPAFDSGEDILLDMISDLIGQSNRNYLHTLIASAKQNSDEVWERFNEGFALDEDIYKLTTYHLMSSLSPQSKHQISQ
jgi:hypothetical protein